MASLFALINLNCKTYFGVPYTVAVPNNIDHVASQKTQIYLNYLYIKSDESSFRIRNTYSVRHFVLTFIILITHAIRVYSHMTPSGVRHKRRKLGT
jgi:hypothetical protein